MINNMNMEKKQKIDSLQVLRTFAFLGIFLSHSHIFPPLGAWGVSVFFILSGFLMSYNYADRKLEFGVLQSLKFSLSKIKRLYLLHVLMTIIAIPYQLYITNNIKELKTIGDLLAKLFLNLTLLQTWIPYMSWYGSFNGVSWFLSVLMFCYFLFPIILHLLWKVNKSLVYIIMVIVYTIQMLFAYCTRNLIFDAGEFWGNYYFAYTFTIFRLGDFIIGASLGMLFLNRKENDPRESVYATIMECISFGLIILSAIIYERKIGILGSTWFRLTLLWIPITCLLVYICGLQKGFFTKLFLKRILILFGNKTNSYFLIHNLVIVYVCLIVSHFFQINYIIYCILAIINLGIIIFSEIIFTKIKTCFINKVSKQQNNS